MDELQNAAARLIEVHQLAKPEVVMAGGIVVPAIGEHPEATASTPSAGTKARICGHNNPQPDCGYCEIYTDLDNEIFRAERAEELLLAKEKELEVEERRCDNAESQVRELVIANGVLSDKLIEANKEYSNERKTSQAWFDRFQEAEKERDFQAANHLRAQQSMREQGEEFAAVEEERNRYRADARELEFRLGRAMEVHAAERQALEWQVKQLSDPIVRAKMLEPSPPIIITPTATPVAASANPEG